MTHLLPFHHFSSSPPPPLPSSSSCSPSSSFNFWSRGASTVQFIGHGKPIPAPRPHTIKCMANPRRVAMVAKQIRRELSDMLITDKNLQYAVLPEAALGADLYLSSVTTISDVEVSADLQVVKVYVSIFGDERGREVALSGLKAKAKYVRGQLGRRMKLRLTPEIRFVEDESLERGSRVIAILDKLKNKNDEQDGKDEGKSEDSFKLATEDDDWGEEDPDEDVIYVR